jgi:transposase
VPIWGAPLLAPPEQQALEHDYHYGKTRFVRRGSQIVLLARQLSSQAAIACVVGCSVDTVRRTLQRYRHRGRAALHGPVRLRHSRTRRTVGWQQALAGAMARGPAACGIERPTWTAPLLAAYLAEQTGLTVSERTVRRGLRSLGYVCRRPTWTLRHKAAAEPDYFPKPQGSKRS